VNIKQIASSILVAAVLVLFIFLVAHNFYWWIVASVVGLAVVLLYERWRTPVKEEAEGEKI
jgi:multisubunit Na+/H+ antiporter MnhE subunit